MLRVERNQGHWKYGGYEKVCFGIDRRHLTYFCFWIDQSVLFGLKQNCIKIE